ncbi:MAG TPA: ABC transporter permease [Opitutaceae bacterium]|nr:ABC transporter permease [Opitutaceae bacterium]
MNALLTDFRCALRRLAKTPGFTVIVLVTLALGIGVNTSMYTLVDLLFFRTVPFAEPERMVSIVGTNPQTQRDNFAFAEIDEMRAQAAGPDRAFQSLTAYAYWNNTLVLPDRPAERLLSIDATADFFTTFHAQPMLGRMYTPEEEVPGKNRVVILSYRTWQTRFGGDPGVIGRSVRLNAEQCTVIGVMPASFSAPLFFGPVDLFRPMTVPRHIVDDRFNRFFIAVGRLNPGVSAAQAKAQLEPLAANWAKDHPQTSKGRGFNLLPPHRAAMDNITTFIIWLLFGIAAAVLVVACANIANLQLARATANMHDLAIRSALGASRTRLIVHQLIEAMLLAIGGGGLGIVLAMWVNNLFGSAIRLGADTTADHLTLPLNGRVLVVAFGISLLTGVLFGLLPAWFASRHDVNNMLKQQSRATTHGRGPRLLRNALIVCQVGVALALLGVAGVMIRGLDALMQREKGWDTRHLLMANIHLPEQSTYASDDKRRVAIEKLSRRLGEIPGADHTAVCSTAPIFGYSKVNALQVEGQTSDDPTKQPSAGYTMVHGDYFATLGIPLREGRLFPAEIKADSPPMVVINESMAKHFWPGQSAIGKRIGERLGENTVWREVIGVVGDIQFALNITDPPTMYQIYKPLMHEPWGYLFLLVNGKAPTSFKNDVIRAVRDIDPDVAVQEMYTVPEAADRYQHNLVVINNTLAGFALLGLILAAVGLYGVVSYLVAQRTPEFGIRLALGATPGNVLQLVMVHGLLLTLVGLVLGLGGGYGLNCVVGSMIPKMVDGNPTALLTTAAVLLAIAVGACFVPARRATRVNPVDALRAE